MDVHRVPPTRLWGAALILAAMLWAAVSVAQPFDVVVAGGRAIDPETGLDAPRHVGVRGDRVVAVSVEPLAAQLAPNGRLIDARGMVVAPGFIDLHAHGQSVKANRYQARDGVTTALELEWGYPRVAEWLDYRRGRAIVHYGASVSHGMLRSFALPELAERADELDDAAAREDPLRAMQGVAREGFYRALPADRMDIMLELLRQGLRQGGLGIGMAHQYYPGASRSEILRVFELSAETGAPIFTHVREMGLGGIQEVVANAAATGAPLHIVHVNSSSLRDLPAALDLIAGVRVRGVDVTTEAYPYTAGSTGIDSAIFDDGWRERLGIDYGDVQWQDTGERLTAESFARYRERGGVVIIHMMSEELIELAMATPFVMIASDGMPFAPGAHPRSAGTFSRVLGRYVRERGSLPLATAIARMTLLPAQRLEAIAPTMRRKGRLQVGADADLVVFDPQRVLDTATFESGPSFSTGIEYVLVAGTLVVDRGESVDGVFPGQPVLGRYATP
ncbi:MAG TPA: amidohydrolase family protein [Thermoanaerobaculia bacterium]|nr:amidohydrolase family protein [Thermoanaerobaculia bacterium]